MTLATGTFREIQLGVQEVGQGDDFMVSRVYFDINLNGSIQNGTVLIKQAVGSDFYDEQVEVYSPEGVSWEGEYGYFQGAVRQYYFNLFGPRGSGVRFPEGAKVSVVKGTLRSETTFEIDI